MARRPSKHRRPVRPLMSGSATAVETSGRTGESWMVRTISGAAATKDYRCPGCASTIRAGVPHLVVWPAEPGLVGAGVQDRRHWHTACWRRAV